MSKSNKPLTEEKINLLLQKLVKENRKINERHIHAFVQHCKYGKSFQAIHNECPDHLKNVHLSMWREMFMYLFHGFRKLVQENFELTEEVSKQSSKGNAPGKGYDYLTKIISYSPHKFHKNHEIWKI